MLTVRDEQIEVFEQHLFDQMQEGVERAIAETFPELCSPTAPRLSDVDQRYAVRAIVERGIESAVEYDIGRGTDFAAFIALGLALRLARPQSTTDWINAYVNRLDTPGEMRLRMIEFRLRALSNDDPAFELISQRIAEARRRAAA